MESQTISFLCLNLSSLPISFQVEPNLSRSALSPCIKVKSKVKSIRFTWSKIWFKSNVSVLIFCLDDLSWLKVGYWSPYYNYIVVYLQICISLMYLDTPVLGAHVFTIIISSWLIDSYYYMMTFFVVTIFYLKSIFF